MACLVHDQYPLTLPLVEPYPPADEADLQDDHHDHHRDDDKVHITCDNKFTDECMESIAEHLFSKLVFNIFFSFSIYIGRLRANSAALLRESQKTAS